MNKKYKFILLLLIVIFAISSFFHIKEILENKKQNDIYDNLQEIVTKNDKNDDITEDNGKNTPDDNYNLKNIKNINSDVVGWIKIDGTNIDYPVMQNGNYYLHRNLYKNYSSHGTPYLAEYCKINSSDNLIIYGHHMKDNQMFSQLDYYKKYEFYSNHKYIKFYTLEGNETIESKYEVTFVFKTIAYTDKGFKYYNYYDFNSEDEFNDFVINCEKLELYNTDIEFKYGDKFITLSTCEYSQKNGRMVIVAKKI